MKELSVAVSKTFTGRLLNGMGLVESWHDADDVSVHRLRAMGYAVVDRPRPRQCDDAATNHGGILVFSSASVRMSVLPFNSPPSFELLQCIRVTSGNSSEILVVVYRPGSQAIQQRFFDDLIAVLERAATYSAPVHVVDDFNVRLDRPDDPSTQQLLSLLNGWHLAAVLPSLLLVRRTAVVAPSTSLPPLLLST